MHGNIWISGCYTVISFELLGFGMTKGYTPTDF